MRFQLIPTREGEKCPNCPAKMRAESHGLRCAGKRCGFYVRTSSQISIAEPATREAVRAARQNRVGKGGRHE